MTVAHSTKNRIQDDRLLDISDEKVPLTNNKRTTLSQLRSRYYRLLGLMLAAFSKMRYPTAGRPASIIMYSLSTYSDTSGFVETANGSSAFLGHVKFE